MSIQIFIDGKFFPKEKAKVSVFDHGLLYGDGVFEGIRAYGGRVFKLAEHMDRLWESAHTLMLTIPMSKEEMQDAMKKQEGIIQSLGGGQLTERSDVSFVNHHMGTCRMGDNPSRSVVSRNLQAHDVSNLFIIGSSNFVTGGAANPTLTIVALTLRAADYIRKL